MSQFAIVTNPLQCDLRSVDFKPVPSDACFDDLLPADIRGRSYYLCAVVGPDVSEARYVLPQYWHMAPPPGHAVVFHRPPTGGDNGSNNALRAILTLVAAFVFQQYYGLAGWQLAGATLAASFAINALIPLEQPTIDPASGERSPTFSGGGNQARLDQAIPELFGRQNPYPDFAAPPYINYDDEGDQYYHAILLVSEGELEILQVAIDDTPLGHFNGVDLARCGPNQSTRSGPGTGYESLQDQTIVATNIVTAIEVSNAEAPSAKFIGPFVPIKGGFRATKIFMDIIFPRGLDESREVSWRIQVRSVDEFGRPIGTWFDLATETYDTPSVTPIRRSYEYDLDTPIRPQVRMIRTDIRTEDAGAAHDMAWGTLRVQLDEEGINYEGATYIAVKIRASEQLNGLTQARFRVLCNRMLQIYSTPDSDGFDDSEGGAADTDANTGWLNPRSTRNIAWPMLYLLRQRYDDDQIDIEQFVALAQIWDARQDRFDFIFDTTQTMWDALAMIARVGRAVPLIRASKVTCWRDQKEIAPVGYYGMRDMIKDSLEIEFSMPDGDPVDAVDLEYYDHRLWDWATVTAQYQGGQIYGYRGTASRPSDVTPPTGAIRIRVPGIIGEYQAIRTAVYHLADMVYRSIRAHFTTEMQGLLPAYGALVVAQHDVGNFGQGGDVVAYNSGSKVLETSEPLEWTPGSRHYVRFVRPNGTLTDRFLVTQATPTPYAMQLGEAPDFDLLYGRANIERTRYVFGEASNMGALCKVRSIVPTGEHQVQLQLVGEDDRVHDADLEWRAGDDVQDPVSDGEDVVPGVEDFVVNLPGRTIEARGGDSLLEYEITLAFGNDGTFRIGTFGGDHELQPNQWLYPQTVTAGVAALYEVKLTLLWQSFASPQSDTFFLGDDLGTWLSLGSSRLWQFTKDLMGDDETATSAVNVQIRIAATEEVQANADFILVLSVFNSPGPGGEGPGGENG